MSKIPGAGPTDFRELITPEKACEIMTGYTLAEHRMHARDKRTCEVCRQLPVWRLASTGLCFPCTTGDSNASDDYELIQE